VFEEATRERVPLTRGPGWWAAMAALVALLAFGRVMPAGALTYGGLVTSALFVAGGVVWPRWRGTDALGVAHSQSFSAAGIIALGVTTGSLAAQLRGGVLTIETPFVWITWTCCLMLAVAAATQIFISTRRLIEHGRIDTARLVVSEREASEAELIVQQQKLEPELVLRAMTVIADQALGAPRDAERAVERLATFLRNSLTTAPAINAPLSDEVTRAQEYEEILAAAGVNIPVAWTIDADVRDVELPGGTLRAFLDYAMSRCLRTPGSAITIRASQHAKRFYLIVKDNAAPDPPMLAEPEALASLRRRLGTPPKRRVRVETSVMFEVDGTSSGTTQTLAMRLPEVA
jgi:hypothetical protein